jgi:hypothetical protein
MNDADSAASTRSPTIARLKPAPAATPLTAVISTAPIRANVEIARCRSSAMPLTKRAAPSGEDAIAPRSPPAQKNRPRPVTTTTLVVVTSHRIAASASSRHSTSFMVLAASGRFSRMRVMGPVCSKVSVW